jgi:hypothetical protein
MKTLRACEVLYQTLPAGSPLLTDIEIFVKCAVCGDIALSTLFLTLKRDITYTCPRTLEPLVILALPDGDESAWKGAYRVGEFAIWHAGDLRFRDTVIPRSELALREIRTRATKERRKGRQQ